MIEAEIKARLKSPGRVREQLDARAHGAEETYADAYFDTLDGSLSARGQELRVRTVTGQRGTRHILTFKDRPADKATQSKPEFEITVDDPQTATTILNGLGFPTSLAFVKECINYDLTFEGRRFLATIVTVREVDGVFLEVETQATAVDLDAALRLARALLAELGVGDGEQTTDTYAEAVRRGRLLNLD